MTQEAPKAWNSYFFFPSALVALAIGYAWMARTRRLGGLGGSRRFCAAENNKYKRMSMERGGWCVFVDVTWCHGWRINNPEKLMKTLA